MTLTRRVQFINDAKHVVNEGLLGMCETFAHLKLLPNSQIIVRSDIEDITSPPGGNSTASKKRIRTTLISGGGSGHEPSHALFVGKGMLSAVVCGNVFTSPDVDSILRAIRCCTTLDQQVGALLIVKSYTGDRLNFRLAMEQARLEGRLVDMIVVGDDCSIVKDDNILLRRGIAGTVFVHKIAGAAAEEGLELHEVKQITHHVTQNITTMGVSAGPCTVPGSVSSSGDELLGEGEIFLGLGIHGEQGVKKEKFKNLSSLVHTIIGDYLMNDFVLKGTISDGDNIALLINNLGGTSNLEMNAITHEVINVLESQYKLKIDRLIVGGLMTALEMPGFSITIFALRKQQQKDFENYQQLLSRLDLQTESPVWPHISKHPTTSYRKSEANLYLTIKQDNVEKKTSAESEGKISSLSKSHALWVREVIQFLAENIIKQTLSLNALDQACGDGDLGSNLSLAASAILKSVNEDKEFNETQTMQISKQLSKISVIVQSMGGSSGPFYAIFLLKSSQIWKEIEGKEDINSENLIKIWHRCFSEGIEAISSLGGAKPGFRTMLDSLCPIRDTLFNSCDKKNLDLMDLSLEIANSAEEGAISTRKMVPKAGRSIYIANEHNFTQKHLPEDPGARAISEFAKAFHLLVSSKK